MEKKTKQITGIFFVTMLMCTSLVALIVFSPLNKGAYTYELNTFQSYDDLRSFLEKRFESAGNQGRYYDSINIMFSKSGAANDESAAGGEAPPSYSTTNVQVAGVDEPDIVKTDGTYLYVVANQTVYIIRAYPVFEAAITSEIRIKNGSISNIFVRGDRLVVFGNTGGFYGYPLLEDDVKGDLERPSMWWDETQQTIIRVYDIADRSDPVLSKDIRIDGSYFDARLIDEYVYMVATEYTYHIYYAVDEKNYTLDIPEIRIDNVSENISAGDIYYVDVPELSDTMTHVISVNLETNDVVEKSFMLGSSQTMYVSKHNIFLASLHYPYYPVFRTNQGDNTAETNKETTILHKISIDTGDVNYTAQGEVLGHILNQFSMDEHNGFFRIATTSGNNWMEGSQTSNNLYILDENLKQVSKIENIAPGESIYAARFLGDRAYLVTFVQVDPLFTIDVSDPYHPRILGELKIPGYSEYLHPYDETHIIGIGKEVDPTIDEDKIHTPGAVYYTAILGLKIALFDVSDIEHPIEQAKIVIGDRGTDSPALYDHKAFLFDREKELLVLPVSLYEITQEVKDRYVESEGMQTLYGEFTFQGAYVYTLSLENGFELQGRITHQTPEQMQHSNDYYWYWGFSNTDITRSLYIGDVLYTISDSMVKMNNLEDLSELSSISLQ
jgi:inhibitor of cysteine peptidase